MYLLSKINYYKMNCPNKIAIITKDKEITYKEFFNNICRCASFLKKYKVSSKDIIIFENTQDEFFCYLYFAINMLSCIALPVDKNTPMKKINALKEKVEAKLIVSIEDVKNNLVKDEKVKEIKYSDKDNTSLLLLSSGSTGSEKIIEYSNSIIYHVVKVYKKLYNLNDSMIILPTGPLCRAYPITRMFISFYYGLTLYIYDSLNVVDLITTLDKYKNLILSTNPTILHYLITLFSKEFEACLSNIKIIESCTAPLNTSDSEKIANMLNKTKFYNFYGATELQISYLDILKYGHKRGLVGMPLENVKVDILDDDGNIIDSNRNHCGIVRVSNKDHGYKYFKKKEKTYFYPGEIGYIENGLLYLIDRQKNFLNVNGYKISPVEVEDITLTCNGVLECICYYYKVLSLDVIVNDSFKMSELKRLLSENLSRYQIPKKINIVDSIKKTKNGKVNRLSYNEGVGI